MLYRLTLRATEAESILGDVVGLVLIENSPEEFVVGGVDIDTFSHVRDLGVFVATGNLAVKGSRSGLPVGNMPFPWIETTSARRTQLPLGYQLELATGWTLSLSQQMISVLDLPVCS
jgi:hypothetical protein